MWQNQERAAKVLKDKNAISQKLEAFSKIESGLEEGAELYAMATSEGEAELAAEAEDILLKTQQLAQKLETEALFSGEHDTSECFVEINAGAGGTESHDWAEMMMRMYLRFAANLGLKSEIINIIAGEEAGIKSCCFKVKGDMAYGWLKSESGVHRLVRISPYNAAGKRMTSFASCWVYPQLDDDIDIKIEDKDIRVDTYRASGAGGQHINTTDSAVRITHLPTNIVVQCQNDRSQHRNKDEAMRMLKARLYDHEMKVKGAEIEKQNQQKSDNGWGHQIRSYVLQPYQMVKDLRTGYETSNSQAVLDGDLEKFVYHALADSKLQ